MMTHTCVGMRASHFVATTVSSRRSVAVSASSRPSCLAPSAAPRNFCKSFQPDHGFRLLCKKPVGTRSTVSRQVPSRARPLSRSDVHQLAMRHLQVCAKAGALEGNMEREAHTLRYAATHIFLSETLSSADLCRVQASWLD